MRVKHRLMLGFAICMAPVALLAGASFVIAIYAVIVGAFIILGVPVIMLAAKVGETIGQWFIG